MPGFKGARVHLLPEHEPGLEFIAPVRVAGPAPFNLLAVWAQNFSGGNTRKEVFRITPYSRQKH